MLMENGAIYPAMARFGLRQLLPDGRRIITATGFGLPLGDGLGWMPRPGVMRHSTTAAGFSSADFGDGLPARSMFVPLMRPRLWVGLEVRAGESAFLSEW